MSREKDGVGGGCASGVVLKALLCVMGVDGGWGGVGGLYVG